jgi:hypothetical protein
MRADHQENHTEKKKKTKRRVGRMVVLIVRNRRTHGDVPFQAGEVTVTDL